MILVLQDQANKIIIFEGMHLAFLLNFVWIRHFALNIACKYKFCRREIIIQRQLKLVEICLVSRTMIVWLTAKIPRDVHLLVKYLLSES